jgi:hypothetical protein
VSSCKSARKCGWDDVGKHRQTKTKATGINNKGQKRTPNIKTTLETKAGIYTLVCLLCFVSSPSFFMATIIVYQNMVSLLPPRVYAQNTLLQFTPSSLPSSLPLSLKYSVALPALS